MRAQELNANANTRCDIGWIVLTGLHASNGIWSMECVRGLMLRLGGDPCGGSGEEESSCDIVASFVMKLALSAPFEFGCALRLLTSS